MPLLLVDLDNTLIDRAGAVDRWAQDFASVRGSGAADAEWLVAADRDGLEPRERFAAMIAGRFGLDARDEGAILAELRGGLVCPHGLSRVFETCCKLLQIKCCLSRSSDREMSQIFCKYLQKSHIPS